MAKAMGRGESLEDKLTLAAVFVTRPRRFVEPETYFDADEVGLLLTKNAAVLLHQERVSHALSRGGEANR